MLARSSSYLLDGQSETVVGAVHAGTNATDQSHAHDPPHEDLRI